MKKMIKPSIIAALITGCFAAQAGDIRGINAANVVPNRYIVVFKDSALKTLTGETRSTAAIADAVGRRSNVSVERSFNHVLNGAVVVTDLANAKKMADDPDVAYVEADQIMRASATQSNATWGIDRIDQTNLPLSGTYTYPASNGVHAYIIDTGLRSTHNEFTGRVGNGYTAVNDGNGTNDCQGHGTHVAGTVGGTTWGVAKNVTIHPVRVLGCDGSGTNSGVIAGMDWVVANAVKPAVANMSLGGGASQATDDAVARLTNAGIVTVVAAGNDSGNACSYSPARAPSAITVGSTTSSDAMSSFSNYGSCVDIYGPGSNITSASKASNTGSTTMSGTSMASPHVAGVAALYLAKYTNATPSQVVSALTSNALTGKITGIPSGVNKFVNTQFLNTTIPPAVTPLTSGTAVSVALATNAQKMYSITVPAGKTSLVITLSGGSGDGDIYARMTTQPTTTSYSKKSDGSTNTENITFSAPAAGTYYILVNAYATVSGASLKAVVN